MGMSSHVVAIRPPDEDWRRLKAVWDACEAAGVAPPQVVKDFFGGEAPDPRGVLVENDWEASRRSPDERWVEEWSSDNGSGFEVRIDKLPPGVKVVRFFNAW